MTMAALQVQLFQLLKTKLGAEASLVNEVAGTLNIGTASAYRRIRGQRVLSIDELHSLCSRYELSMDALLQLKNGSISFEGQYVNPHSLQFREYLVTVSSQLEYMASFPQQKLYYLCKDIPLFHHYHSRALAAFKYFFWQKTIFGSPELTVGRLRLSDYPDDLFELGKKVLDTYNKINAYEIWNMESLNSTLRQVEFYHDTAAFYSNDDLLQVYEAIEDLFLHLEKQAETGYQFNNGNKKNSHLGEYHFYINEVMIGDNSILAILGDVKLAFLTHSGINFMLTRNVDFCENLLQYYQSLMRRSTLVSKVSERERASFFHGLRRRIIERKKMLRS